VHCCHRATGPWLLTRPQRAVCPATDRPCSPLLHAWGDRLHFCKGAVPAALDGASRQSRRKWLPLLARLLREQQLPQACALRHPKAADAVPRLPPAAVVAASGPPTRRRSARQVQEVAVGLRVKLSCKCRRVWLLPQIAKGVGSRLENRAADKACPEEEQGGNLAAVQQVALRSSSSSSSSSSTQPREGRE